MENQDNTIYCGKGKQVHENITNISLCLDDIKGHTFEYKDKTYVRLQLIKRKQADEYGKTHFLKINDYDPNNQKQAVKEPVSAGTGLPF